MEGAVASAVIALRRADIVHNGPELGIATALTVVLLFVLDAALGVWPRLDNHLLHVRVSVVVSKTVVPVAELHMPIPGTRRLYFSMHWRVGSLPSGPSPRLNDSQGHFEFSARNPLN